MASRDAATLSIAGLGGLTLALAMRMSAINIEQMQLARAAADPKRAAARFLQGTALLSHSPHSILSIRAIITIRLSRVPPSLCPLSSIACLSVCSLCLMSAVSCPLSPCLPVSHSLVLFSVYLSHSLPLGLLVVYRGVPSRARSLLACKGTYYKSWSRAQLNNVEYAPMLAVLMLLIKYKAERRRGHTRTSSSPGTASSTGRSSSSARRAEEGEEGEGGGELTAFEKLSCYGALAR